MMYKYFSYFSAVIMSICFASSGTAKPTVDVNQVVRDAELVRTVTNAESAVTLQTEQVRGKKKRKISYEMLVLRGEDKKAFVDFTGPAEEKGRKMLVIDKQYWARFPDSQRVHRISRKEMIGNSVFQLVDLFQLDVASDYTAKLVETIKVGKILCYKVMLSAKHSEAPYSKVEYLISKKGHFPVLAKFFSDSGKKLKTLKILRKGKLDGILRPLDFVMVDNVTKGRKSYWKTMTLVPRPIPASVFDRSYMQAH